MSVDISRYSRLEVRLARALYQTDYLLHSIHLNLGKQTLPIYDEQQRRMREELLASDGELCNYVGPLSRKEFDRLVTDAALRDEHVDEESA